MGGITFTKGQGGLNRRLTGEDHISGLIFYLSTLPAGFAANDRIKEVYDLVSAESLGITSDNASVDIKVMHYHTSEFFRINPGARLYIAIYDSPAGAHTFDEIVTLQDYAEGRIRQVGVFTSKAFDIAQIALLQSQATALEGNKKMLSILYAADITALATGNINDLTNQTAPNVSWIVGQDGEALGADLFTAFAKSITCLGTALGTTSKAKVNECIGWVGQFPVDAVELAVPALANGDKMRDLGDGIVTALINKRVIFLRKYIGDSRTYFADSPTATIATDDYAYIENVRTIDKAIRQVYLKLLPQVNAPVNVDAQTGKLDPEYVTHLENLGDSALAQMERDGELSGYQTFVNPDQDVLSSSTITVSIINVPVGVSRQFSVNIGFANKVPS